MTLSQTERQSAIKLMRELGPAAPTLCSDWTVKDMAVHLYIRENHPRAAAGILWGSAQSLLEEKTKQISKLDLAVLLERLESGSRFAPLRWGDRWLNSVEYFVHHEDIRRAQPGMEQRQLSLAEQAELYQRIKFFAPLLLRKSHRPVVFEPTGLPRFVAHEVRGVAKAGDQVATVRGAIGELTMWLFGRDKATVEIHDPHNSIRRSSA